MKLLTLASFFLLQSTSQGANILGIFPINGKSHYVMYENLLLRLAEIGHSVDVVTHFVTKEAPPRYNQLSIAGTLPALKNNLTMKIIDNFDTLYNTVYTMVQPFGVAVCENAFNTDVVKNLKTTKKKYDLVITETFGSDCMLGFAHLFQVPVITMTSSVNLPWANDRFGNPDSPSYIPNYFFAAGTKMNLYERLCNTWYLLATKLWYYQLSTSPTNELNKKFFGPSIPPVEDLVKNISLMFVNSHLSFSFPRPTVPSVVEVGGIHLKEPKPLSKHFQEVLNTDKKGIIYLSMGSMVVTETFDPDKLQGMFDAFGQLPYKVVWKAVKKKFPQGLNIPENIHFEEWIPQMDVLCDPRTKLYVGHGGLLGFQEAIYCGVPLLGIPLFADQIHNIHSSEKLGFGVKVEYKDISEKTILSAATKLLDTRYKKTAEKLSRHFKDRPMSAMDTAVFWTEYVLRHQGAPHLRSAGGDLPWYQYYLVDVAGVFLSTVIPVLYVLFKIMKFVLLLVFGKDKQKAD